MERTKTKVDMKKIILAVLVALITNIANAQNMIVYSLKGNVEDVTTSTARPVRLRDDISPNTILNIPYQGCVVLYDESSSQQFTLKKPGRATVKEMIADSKNSVKKLTGDYLAFIKKQITGGGQILVRNCSQPATVTRELGVAANYGDQDSNLMICGTQGYAVFSESLTDSFDEFTRTVEDEFKVFTDEVIKEYRNFRDSVLNDYANFVRNPWKKVTLLPPEKKPQDEKIKPILIKEIEGKLVSADFDKHKTAAVEKINLFDIQEETADEEIEPLKVDNKGKAIVPDFDKNKKNKSDVAKVKPIDIDGNLKPINIEENVTPLVIDEKSGKPVVPNFGQTVNGKKPELVISVLPLPQPLPIPKPIIPVECLENNEVTEKFHSFNFYGTEMKVRWSDDCKFHLRSTSENDVADAIQLLSRDKYDNLLHDCLQLRDKYHLGDWAYYQMLKQLSASICGKDTNEATMLMAMLYSQSGYRQRLARSGDKLLQLVATQFFLYDFGYYILDGHNFYLLDGNYPQINLCEAQFKKEQEMSLVMNDSPSFMNETSEPRTISSWFYKDLKANVAVNKNLMDFYSKYPSSHFNNDFMTRWAMYANKEMQPEVREQLYPQLKTIIAGKSQKESAECILKWIQTAFKYEYDDVVWGHDRAFFPEESLYYPSCDCEDRSILYTRLIRDLLGLKCILVYYPGHLASGVCFTENIDGDYINVEGDRYIVCDPTILSGTPVGWTMRGMKNNEAKVIVLK